VGEVSYFAFNLPLQVWPVHEDPFNEKSPVTGTRILNYMPRKEGCRELLLEECLEGKTREEFFERTAQILENLAQQMRKAGKDPELVVYYPDTGEK
jgi:hypothetical protein